MSNLPNTPWTCGQPRLNEWYFTACELRDSKDDLVAVAFDPPVTKGITALPELIDAGGAALDVLTQVRTFANRHEGGRDVFDPDSQAINDLKRALAKAGGESP